ncbi:MAG: M42 family metallopeptidase [Clostridia bacterium]|nr:M42 family metallopeptidase [Clostridia bacterium]
MLDKISELVSICGVSGNEQNVCEYIKKELTPFADKLYSDVMGNLVAVKRGNGPRIMFMAHTDEIGIVATFVDEKGFVRVAAVGGVSPKNFINSHVTFENGTRGVFTCDKAKDFKFSDCYVDIGATDRAQALSMLDIGMTARFDADCFETDSVIVSKTLDDRIGCYILMEAIKNMPASDAEVYFVFTSQEEVGLRGAKVSGFDINPDIAIAVDVTVAADTPDCESYGCKLGGGAAIKIRDASAICSRSVVDSLETLAAQKNIPYQRDVLVRGGTDIGAVQTGGRGSLVGGISVAVRNVHSASEMASKSDVRAAIELVRAYIENPLANKL